MAVPLPKPNQPLLDVLGQISVTEREMADVLKDASEELERTIPKLIERHTTGSKVRAGQLLLVKKEIHVIQAALWGDVGRALNGGVEAAVLAASQGGDLLFSYLAKHGVDIPELRAAFEQQARNGFEAVKAKAYNDIPLSRQVYRTQALAQGMVDRKVSVGLLMGKSAKDIAKDVKHLVRPDVAGGVSYAAFRLGRTEINNAYKTAQENRYDEEPWVKGMRWNLSRSHPRPDECDRYAAHGVYPVGQRPKSHPNCLCYLTPEQESEEDFIENFLRGEYNTWIDEQIYTDAPKQVRPCR